MTKRSQDNETPSGTRIGFVVLWSCFLILLPASLMRAQTQPQVPPSVIAQAVMQPQPPVDNSHLLDVSATAEFDPPTVRVGDKALYRVTVTATGNSIPWPDIIAAPPELKFGLVVRGQLTQPDGVKFQPLTSFLYEVTPSKPGRFTVPSFVMPVGSPPVQIPAATLEAVDAGSAGGASPRRLRLELSDTNVFFGQPIRVRVMLPAKPGSQIEALRDVQFNGGGIFVDKLAVRQTATSVEMDGRPTPVFIYECAATPMAAGPVEISAQAFSVSLMGAGTVSITASGGSIQLNAATQVQNVLLVSDAVQLNVRPLPARGELPGFTGAIGKFTTDRSMLSTNRVRVGETLVLKYSINPGTNLVRFVPPETPRSREWQIIADNNFVNGYNPASANSFTNSFTLIPLTDEATNTPAIPFSCFDPATAKYVDLTVPPLPLTVVGAGLPVQLAARGDGSQSAAPLKLSGLMPSPGKTVDSLKPLQMRGWFICLQLAPVFGFVGLWQWDRRRRFLEAHPEIVRRRKAGRDLRREKSKLRKSVAAGDASAFVEHAANALKICCAPHFPAHPRALVCADVLSRLDNTDASGRAGETVRKIFAAADAQFAAAAQTKTDCLSLRSDVESVLQKLEEKL
jgi:hypothetical protein